MIMGDKVLLVDGNNLAYRFFAALPPLNSPSGEFTQITFGVLKEAVRSIKHFNADRAIIVWDGGRRARTDIYPEYKANRGSSRSPEDLIRIEVELIPQMNTLIRILPDFGISQYKIKDVEADDVISVLSSLDPREEVVILSEDKDMLQLIDKNISVHRPIKGITYTCYNFEELIGVKTPNQFINARFMIGDPSDNIKGVKGIGEKTAFSLVLKYGGVRAMLRDKEFLMSSKRTANILAEEDVIFRNERLMDLRHSKKYVPNNFRYMEIKGNLSEASMLMHMKDLGLKSMIRNFSDWIDTLIKMPKREEEFYGF